MVGTWGDSNHSGRGRLILGGVWKGASHWSLCPSWKSGGERAHWGGGSFSLKIKGRSCGETDPSTWCFLLCLLGYSSPLILDVRVVGKGIVGLSRVGCCLWMGGGRGT